MWYKNLVKNVLLLILFVNFNIFSKFQGRNDYWLAGHSTWCKSPDDIYILLVNWSWMDYTLILILDLTTPLGKFYRFFFSSIIILISLSFKTLLPLLLIESGSIVVSVSWAVCTKVVFRIRFPCLGIQQSRRLSKRFETVSQESR